MTHTTDTNRMAPRTVTGALLALLFVLAAAGCGGGGTRTAPAGSTAVTISYGTSGPATAAMRKAGVQPRAIPVGVSSIRITVTGEGMEEDMVTVPVTAGEGGSTTLTIPNGAARHFVVEALNADDTVLYRGEADADLLGTPVDLVVNMLPVGGGGGGGAVWPSAWNWRNPRPTGNDLNGVAYGGGGFVAVGDFGGIYAIDPVSGAMVPVANPASGIDLNAIARGDGTTLVAVGGDGSILSSADGGLTWTAHASPGIPLHGVTYGNGTFVAVGEMNTILTSTDNGATWTTQAASGDVSSSFYAAAYGGGGFVAGGESEGGSLVLISPDGISWTPAVSNTSEPVWSLAYGYGYFVAGGPNGSLERSPDGGDTWSRVGEIPSFEDVLAVGYGNGAFVASVWDSEGGRITYSTDAGATWNWVVGGSVSYIYGFAYGGAGGFMGVGSDGYVMQGSAAADSWATVSTSVTDDTVQALGYGNGTFVAGAGTRIFRSTDGGVNWGTTDAGGFTAEAIAFGNGTFVAVGESDRIRYSTDGGVDWGSAAIVSYGMRGAAFGNGTFVAVGLGGTFLYSQDNGASWDNAANGSMTKPYGAVAYGNGRFLAVSNYGIGNYVLSSTNGIDWSPVGTDVHYMAKLAFGNGVFVGVGRGVVLVSTDNGVTWTEQVPGPYGILNDVAYSNGVFAIAAGNGVVLTSTDNGETWTPQTPVTYRNLTAISAGNGTFVAGGESGTIIQSDPYRD